MTQEQAGTTEISRVIANGCPHRWEPIWWKPTQWMKRAVEIRDPKDGKVIVSDRAQEFTKAGFVKAYRCGKECGLAYLKNTGGVVPALQVNA